jgi:ribosomal protein L11 methyltransferase
MRFGRRLWVCPGGQRPPADALVEGAQRSTDEPVLLELDPGLAFGTGTHATTALCLEWLDGSELAGCRVVDYGCGSGILAIAALKLGAAEALAFDIDPQARLATRDNAVRNGVADRLTVAATAPHEAASCDALVANILPGPLTELAGRFATLLRPGGRIALSGVLAEQAGTVAAAYGPWFIIGATTVRDGWALLSGSRGPIT